MRLVVLGSGTSVPHAQRASAAFWLETETRSLLLDCGADTAHRMAEERLDWPNLDAIWISHLHLDHCGGLPSYLFALKWAPQTEGRQKDLAIFGCAGIENLLKAIDGSNDYGLFDQRFPILVRELPALEFGPSTEFEIFPGLSAQTFSTPHTRESLAIRLTGKDGASLVYTSDTGYSDELTSFARGADLLIVECSFRRAKRTPRHLELVDAMLVARLAAPRKVVLTHLYPEWDGVNIEAEAGKLWAGEIIVAVDGLRIGI